MNPPQRKSPRLTGYDYRQNGLYFVTLCAYQRLHRFGEIQNGTMHLTPLGQLAESDLAALPTHWATVAIDAYVVMPNHLHAIVVLDADPKSSSHPTLGRIIGNYKAGVTRAARERGWLSPDVSDSLWQGRYHDHIIRDEQSLQRIQAYIAENPARWDKDVFFG